MVIEDQTAVTPLGRELCVGRDTREPAEELVVRRTLICLMATEHIGEKVTTLHLILVHFMHFMYSSLQLKKRTQVIKISNSILQSPGFWSSRQDGGLWCCP